MCKLKVNQTHCKRMCMLSVILDNLKSQRVVNYYHIVSNFYLICDGSEVEGCYM